MRTQSKGKRLFGKGEKTRVHEEQLHAYVNEFLTCPVCWKPVEKLFVVSTISMINSNRSNRK